MPEFKVTRTFHPIGQGAFYSEYFQEGSHSFLMVYDCGATNSIHPPKALCKEVRDSFHQDRYDSEGRLVVDILFLSHFHNDHLNGVGLLAPKKVVCPLISDDDVLMLKVIDQSQSEWNVEAMSDPSILFSNRPEVIRVSPMQSAEAFEGSNQISPLDGLAPLIQSGTRIGVSLGTVDLGSMWYFIPYNFHYRGRIDEFKKKLSDKGLSYDQLKLDPHAYIMAHRADLRAISNTFTGNTNDQSLLLYSGPVPKAVAAEYRGNDYSVNWADRELLRTLWAANPDRMAYYLENHPYLIDRYAWYLYPPQRHSRPASIYYGDITLTEELVCSFTSGLSLHMESVGTIQLPHHGSDRSFHESVLCYFRHGNITHYPSYSVLYVMCAGSKSKTHPGKMVMTTLSRTLQPHVVVKDQRATSLTEEWLIFTPKDS